MSGVLNPVVMRITFRATMSRKRALLFAIPAVLLLGISGLLKATQPAATQWAPTFLGTFGFSVVLPLTALIIGISVLGAEIDDGSVIHLLATPVRLSTVVFTKFAVAVILTIVTGLDYLVRAWHVYSTAKAGRVDQPPAPGAG